jgi:hypothetical protein
LGADDIIAAAKFCGTEKESTNASIFFRATLLISSKFMVFEVPSDKGPPGANSSVLYATQ